MLGKEKTKLNYNEKHLANLVHNYIKMLGKSEENYPYF